jgi:hypothetical protein
MMHDTVLLIDPASLTLSQWIWITVPVLLGAANLVRAASDRPPFPISLSFLSPREIMIAWAVLWLAAAIGTAVGGQRLYTLPTLTGAILHALYFIETPLHGRGVDDDSE